MVLVFIWGRIFYQFIAPHKEPRLILLLIAGGISYFLLLSAVAYVFIKILKFRHLVLVPVVFIIALLFMLDRYTFIYMSGLALISEIFLFKKKMKYPKISRQLTN